MSRTYKDRRPRRYTRGGDWIDHGFLKKELRKRIRRLGCANGGAYKKLQQRLDPYGGM